MEPDWATTVRFRLMAENRKRQESSRSCKTEHGKGEVCEENGIWIQWSVDMGLSRVGSQGLSRRGNAEGSGRAIPVTGSEQREARPEQG